MVEKSMYNIGHKVYVQPFEDGPSYRGEIIGKAVFTFKYPEYLVNYTVENNYKNQRWFVEQDITLAIT